MLIDTHAHLTFPEFAGDLPQVIARSREKGIEAIINVALDEASTGQSLKLSKEYAGFLYTAAGLHPHDAKDWNEDLHSKFRALAKTGQIIAMGETGLDYHYKLSPIEQQQAVFRKHLQVAQEFDLPAIIHSREAAGDTIKISREENKGKLKGVLHCFAGDMDLGQTALGMGLYISFTGNISYPKAQIIRDAAKAIPLNRILIETDCPFLSPQEFRGKRNEPSFVVKVAEKIAEVKKISLEEVARQTTKNAKQLFGI